MMEGRLQFERLRRKYRFVRSAETLTLGLSAAVVAYGILHFTPMSGSARLGLAVGAGAILFAALFVKLGLHSINRLPIIRMLDKTFPEMQDSADLLIKTDQLTALEMLQREKVQQKFIEIYPRIRLPHRLWSALGVFGISLTGTLMLLAFQTQPGAKTPGTIEQQKTAPADPVRLPAEISSLEITIHPPRYTRIQPYKQSNPTLEAPEGSTMTWSITFTDSVQNAIMIFAGDDSIRLAQSSSYTHTTVARESSLYVISWRSENERIRTSDHYRLTVIPDAEPEIRIRDLEQFTQATYDDNLVFNFNTDITDDHGLTDAYIIATVSKGSGESVKFREEKLPFHSPNAVRGKQLRASRSLDLPGLGLEPGDELYFYVEALDNKTPVRNKSRSETFFIAVRDTATHVLTADGGLGVDLMPEYFRSQRQIIIDSEKLLRDRKSISRHEFNSRSNELGYDQKVLRLKYGEFLGEEFETSIGPGNEIPDTDNPDESGEAEDPTAQYAHTHDKENEHNLVQEKKTPADHDHESEADPEKKEDPAEAYRHVHDDPEEATFFTQSIRTKLKAALTVMWDAELHLRMFDPEKSLPYQYQALKLLKEISNDSRIYVHRTGFDPPPLKEEKRLTGDLSEIESTQHHAEQLVAEKYTSVKLAAAIVDRMIASERRINSSDKTVLLRAGQEIARVALEYPAHLHTLSLIKLLAEEDPRIITDRKQLAMLRKGLWNILKKDPAPSQKTAGTRHPLDQTFMQKLENLKNE